MFGLRRHEEPRSNNRACDCDRAPCGWDACFQSASARIVSIVPTDQTDAPDWQGQGSHRLFYSPGASVVAMRLNLRGSHTRLDKSGMCERGLGLNLRGSHIRLVCQTSTSP